MKKIKRILAACLCAGLIFTTSFSNEALAAELTEAQSEENVLNEASAESQELIATAVDAVEETATESETEAETEIVENNGTVATLESLGLTEDNAIFIAFTDEAASVSTNLSGFSDIVSEDTPTTVTISAAGTYVLSGSCSNGNITVKKGSGEVTLVLNGLTLTEPDEGYTAIDINSSDKKPTTATITVVDGTTNTLSDASHDGTKPKSCINSSSDLTFNGNGTLNVKGNNKNGIKSDTNLIFNDNVILNVNALNDAISADEQVTVNGGTFNITAGGDGIVSNVDTETTDETTGTTTTTSTGNVYIYDGSFIINATGDGLQAGLELIIQTGDFNITTNGGYKTTLAEDADSCKALKAGTTLTTYGGTFVINSADDAIHSNAYINLVGGTFTIQTGDDGAHADTTLVIGADGSTTGPNITVSASYEGLEGGTVDIYGGTANVTATDDGINAAGDSSSGDSFNPGGGNGPGAGGGGGFNPGFGWNSTSTTTGTTTTTTTTSTYSINIYGGTVNINCEGDGLDSNGTISMTGGTAIVIAAASNGSSSDNSALDYETSCIIKGGTILAAGAPGVGGGMSYSGISSEILPSSGSQTYIYSTSTFASGKYINVYDANSKAVMSVQLTKQVNRVVYSSPSTTSSYKIVCGSTAVSVDDSGSSDSGSSDSGSDSGSSESGGDSGSTDPVTPTQPTDPNQPTNPTDPGTNPGENVPQAPTGLWADGIVDYDYTGSAITQANMSVYDGTTLLTLGTDYTVKYSNNVKAGTATIKITCKGNYSGTLTKTFTINPLSLGDGTTNSSNLSLIDAVVKYTGKVIKSTTTATYLLNGKWVTLKKGTDFTYSYTDSDYKSVGTYTVTIVGKGNYTGQATFTETILEKTTTTKLLSKLSFTKPGTQTATGSEVKPSVTLKDGKYELVEGTDYELSYENNVAIGTATVIATGKGNYAGSVRATFKIAGTTIAKKVTVSGIENKTYSGSYITQSDYTLTYDGTTSLVEGTDYTVTYKNNLKAGTATIIFTGCGKYSGTLKKTFTIAKGTITETCVTPESIGAVIYTKGGAKPSVTVTVDGRTLIAGTDYKLTYSNYTAINDGTGKKVPTVTITGCGNYSGKVSKTYTIKASSLENCTAVATDVVYANKAGICKPTVVVTDTNGAKLKAGTDYKIVSYTYAANTTVTQKNVSTTITRAAGATVESKDIIPLGTVINVKLSGLNNYADSTIRTSFTFVKGRLNSATIKIPNQTYTGTQISLDPSKITVKIGSTTLSPSDYEIVSTSYTNAVNKGKAYVTIKGIGNYGGSKTVSFNIVAKTL